MHRVDGYYGLTCFNGLSEAQQKRVLQWGNLEFGYVPAGECPNPAEVSIETKWDKAPGPRFYCVACAVAYIQTKGAQDDRRSG